MPDDIAAAVSSFLEYLGFEVEPVEEGATKSPDLFAMKEGELFLIEVKAKHDEARREEKMKNAFEQGSLFEEDLPMGRCNRLLGIVQHGVRQLGAHANDDPLRLLWFVVRGPRAKVYASQVRATLLGSTRVFDLQDTSWQRECFFFYHSDFYRWRRELDGAVIAGAKSGQLLVNPFSPRADRLRCSPLAVTFGVGVLDLVALEEEGDACLVDSDVDRSDEAAVQQFVQQKYGRPMLQSIEIDYHGVWAGLPLHDGQEDGEAQE